MGENDVEKQPTGRTGGCSFQYFQSKIKSHWLTYVSSTTSKTRALASVRTQKKRNGRKQRRFSMTTSMPKDNKNCSISKLECCPSIRAALCLRPEARDQKLSWSCSNAMENPLK